MYIYIYMYLFMFVCICLFNIYIYIYINKLFQSCIYYVSGGRLHVYIAWRTGRFVGLPAAAVRRKKGGTAFQKLCSRSEVQALNPT